MAFDKYLPEDINPFYVFADQKFKNPDDVSVIFDIGSLHCLESIEFAKKYKNATIFAFEANPDSYQVCLENTKDIDNIVVINKAVNNYDGICKFYAIDPEKTVSPLFDKNRGASSLYKSNGAYDHVEKYVQNEIEVPCTRVDTFCKENEISQIDLVWMDLQGAELLALESMGEDLLSKVQVIHTELEMNPMYENQFLYSDVNSFLDRNKFRRVTGDTSHQFGTNFVYINQRK